MSEIEHMSGVMGYLVISQEEGAKLGAVSDVFIDTKNKKVSGLCFKPHKIGKEEFFVKSEDIQKIGHDIIFISHKDKARPHSKTEDNSQISLSQLTGHIVATADGEHLGKLCDLDIDAEQWTISELWLDHNKRLPIKAEELKIGPDQLIVPQKYAQDIVQEENPRQVFLKKVMGAEGIGGLMDKVKHKFEKNNDKDKKRFQARIRWFC